jgi:hypothetical protein
MMKRLVVLFAFAALVPASALAATQAAVSTYGVRAGFSSNPDQLVLGGQMTIGDVAPSLSFDPNVEFGFGDNVTLIALNLDMHYHFDLRDTAWSPYLGAGAGINFYSVDVAPPFADDSFTRVGGNIIVGASVPTRSGNQFFGELKLGVGDVPDLKMLVGWNFRH